MVSQLVLVGGVLLAVFAPPAAFAFWIRGVERYEREPWGAVFKAFAWGATGGVILALVLGSVLGARPDALASVGVSPIVFLAVVIAPIVEEATKALGLRWVHDAHVEPEDGLVYGAAAGLGFAATENLVYVAAAYLEGGMAALVVTMVARTFSSTFLHATATALVGFAIWKRRAGRTNAQGVVVAYLGAVALHAAYNLGASIELAFAVLGSFALAIGGVWWVRRRIRELDRAEARWMEV